MSVPWEVRLLLWQVAVVCFITGLAWQRNRPKYGSPFGLKFVRALESEDQWRRVHRLAGKWAMAVGAWIALPFPSLESMLFIQIPMTAALSFGGMVIVWNRTCR